MARSSVSKPVSERQHGKRDLALLQGQCLAEIGDGLGLGQPMIGEHGAEALARAIRPAGDDDAQAAP